MTNPYKRMARELTGYPRPGSASYAQLRDSSIEDGAVDEYDDQGQLVASYGKQFDGTHVAATYSGPIPPTSSAPVAEGGVLVATVSCKGTFIDDNGLEDVTIISPMDFSRFEIHASKQQGFIADLENTLTDTFESPRGGEKTIKLSAGPDGQPQVWYIKLVTRSLSGKASAPSQEVSVIVSAPVSNLDLDALEEQFNEDMLALRDALDDTEAALDLAEGRIFAAETDIISAFGRLDVVEPVASSAATAASEAQTKADTAQAAAEAALRSAVKSYHRSGSSKAGIVSGSNKNPVTWTVVDEATSPGGKALRKTGTDNNGYDLDGMQDFDPAKLYRITYRIKVETDSAIAGSGRIYAGILGFQADGLTAVSAGGANSWSSAHYFAAANRPTTVSEGVISLTGYFRGYTGTGLLGGQSPNISNPGRVNEGVRKFIPMLLMDYLGGDGVWQLQSIDVDVIPSEAEKALIGAEAAKTAATDAQTAAGSAQTTANQALTSANGKNARFRSTSAPSGSGTTIGDTWWQYSDTTFTVVIGTWTWAGVGTPGGWIKDKLGHQAISSVDLGALTVVGQSTLSDVVAQNIAARSGQFINLDVSQLTVTGTSHFSTAVMNTAFADMFATRRLSAQQVYIGPGANSIVDPYFEDPVARQTRDDFAEMAGAYGRNSTLSLNWFGGTGQQTSSPKYFYFHVVPGSKAQPSGLIPARAGEKWKFRAKVNTTGGGARFGMYIAYLDGSSGINFTGWDVQTYSPAGLQDLDAVYTIPAGTAYMLPVIEFSAPSTACYVYGGAEFRAMTDGSLLVSGSVTVKGEYVEPISGQVYPANVIIEDREFVNPSTDTVYRAAGVWFDTSPGLDINVSGTYQGASMSSYDPVLQERGIVSAEVAQTGISVTRGTYPNFEYSNNVSATAQSVGMEFFSPADLRHSVVIIDRYQERIEIATRSTDIASHSEAQILVNYSGEIRSITKSADGTQTSLLLQTPDSLSFKGFRLDEADRALIGFASGWTNFSSSFNWFKTAQTSKGTIAISGMIKPGTLSSGIHVGTVVEAHRPDTECRFAVVGWNGSAGVALMARVSSTGQVNIFGNMTGISYVCFGNVYFLRSSG